MNKNVVVAVSNFESEILYLNRGIGQLEMELQTGGGKSYYTDMFQELKDELTTKQVEQVDLQKSYHELELSETFLQIVMHDIRMMINMLEDEMKNPQLKNDDEVLYQKVVVAESE